MLAINVIDIQGQSIDRILDFLVSPIRSSLFETISFPKTILPADSGIDGGQKNRDANPVEDDPDPTIKNPDQDQTL